MTAFSPGSGPTAGYQGAAGSDDVTGQQACAGAVSREVATAQVEPGPGYVARSGDMVLWAEQAPGPRGTEALDAAILGLSEIAARALASDQAMGRISTLLSDARVASLAGLAAVVPTATGMLSIAAGWGTVASADDAITGNNGNHDGDDQPFRGADPSADDGIGGRSSGGATVRMTQLNHELLMVGRQDVAARLAAVGLGNQPATVGLIHGVVPGGAVQVATRLTLGANTGETVVTQAPAHSSSEANPGDRSPPPPRSAASPSAPPPPSPPPDANETAEQDLEILTFRGSSGGGYAEALPLDSVARPGEPPGAGAGAPNGSRSVVIEGIECVRGHLNAPLALNCGTCGVSMIKHSGSRVEGFRPPLGIVVLDDGATYALASPLIIGTTPDQADAVRDGRARAVPLVDHSGQIEPVHAELRLDGWQVALVDWSTKGTYILPEGAQTWQAAPRGAPLPLAPGTRIAVGGRVATYDNPVRAVR